MTKLVLLTVASGAILLTSNLFAGNVVYSGSDIDLGSGWRTSSVTKSVDAGGNNILGSDGWIMPDGTNVTPSYVSSLALNGSFYPGNTSYAQIDNPNSTPGVAPTLQMSQTWNPIGTANLASFTFTGTVPMTVQISLMVDNLDYNTFNPSALQILQTAGGTGDSGLISTTGSAYSNGVPDWLYFTITGAQAGDVYSVISQGGVNNVATLGAVAFDSSVSTPEPSTLSLLGLSTACIGFGLRRKKQA